MKSVFDLLADYKLQCTVRIGRPSANEVIWAIKEAGYCIVPKDLLEQAISSLSQSEYRSDIDIAFNLEDSLFQPLPEDVK